MLILLFIFVLIRHLQGAPTAIHSIPGCDPTNIFVRDDPINHHLGTRQVSDIVISCLATIFACTWTAIHPNIPGPCDSGWEIFKRQVMTMIYAILAPEAVTGWALRQNLAARKIARDYNWEISKSEWLAMLLRGSLTHIQTEASQERSMVERLQLWFHRKPLARPLGKDEVVPWTVTHGFFLQMGGFMVCKDGQPVQTLDKDGPTGIFDLIGKRNISAPRTTEAEIQDRSKGDGLTKTIVVLQTTWFIAQCIVRWSSSLHVTELEVVTLGFAMLNALTYGLWWNKPQSVGLPVYLEMKESGGSATEQAGVAVEEGEGQAEEQNQPTDAPTAAPMEECAPPPKRSYLSAMLERDRGTGWQLLWRMPYRLIQAALRPLSRMMDFSRTFVDEGDLRVPMFYTAGVDSEVVVYIASSAIASIFGLIHLIPAWFLEFPSHPEMLLWLISAGIITAQPIVLGIWAKRENGYIVHSYRESSPLAFLSLLGLPLYFIARLALIILALLSLRKLDGNTLFTVDWISFIPHF